MGWHIYSLKEGEIDKEILILKGVGEKIGVFDNFCIFYEQNQIKTLIINRFFDLIYVRGKNCQRAKNCVKEQCILASLDRQERYMKI